MLSNLRFFKKFLFDRGEREGESEPVLMGTSPYSSVVCILYMFTAVVEYSLRMWRAFI